MSSREMKLKHKATEIERCIHTYSLALLLDADMLTGSTVISTFKNG